MTKVTDKINGLEIVETPSVTLKTKFELPDWFSAGLIVAVQFGAVPEKTIFATGTNGKFEDVALIDVEQFKTLSTSLIVNGTAIVPFSKTVWFDIAEMTGG